MSKKYDRNIMPYSGTDDEFSRYGGVIEIYIVHIKYISLYTSIDFCSVFTLWYYDILYHIIWYDILTICYGHIKLIMVSHYIKFGAEKERYCLSRVGTWTAAQLKGWFHKTTQKMRIIMMSYCLLIDIDWYHI